MSLVTTAGAGVGAGGRAGSPPTATASAKSASKPAVSPSTLALLSLSQDVAALISLSVEASASFVHDWVRTVLGTVGMGDVVPRPVSRSTNETGRGLGIVVVGASEPTGQSLTLQLAKSGYTVFPFIPLPTPQPNPTSHPLPTLVFTWAAIQKRLRTRFPKHPGEVIPVMTDSESDEFWSSAKARSRFKHATETVHAYCAETGLALVAIICVPRSPSSAPLAASQLLSPASVSDVPQPNAFDFDEPTSELPASPDLPPQNTDPADTPSPSALALRAGPDLALSRTDEHALLSMYRANVLDPLSVIRELHDLLTESSKARGTRGRILFVEGGGAIEDFGAALAGSATADGVHPGAASRMVAAAREEAARLLRLELGSSGIDVCEVAVGPMSPKLRSPLHIRQRSGDSVDSARKQDNKTPTAAEVEERDGLSDRLRLLARIFAVDEALLYSSVRRAIEDRYPRARHHAGLVPLIRSLAEITPGSGIIKVLGRWVLGRLFAR